MVTREELFSAVRLIIKNCKEQLIHDCNECALYDYMYDVVLSKDGKFHLTCTDVSDHDFVEVVRCKDCYAYQRNPDFAKAADLNPEEYCALLRCEFGPDGFCSYGRRAENGN